MTSVPHSSALAAVADSTLVFDNSIASSVESSVRIVLTMIVRNESAIFGRCYQSVRNIIDGAVICDTGSTDSTVSLVTSLVQHLPSAVHSHEWKNFGHNRTLSAQACVAFVRRMGWNPAKTYMLFVDADMCLRVRNDFVKQNLTRLGYLINQEAQGTVYSNMRLARCDGNWQCTGVTHEYWEPKNFEVERFESEVEFAQKVGFSHSASGTFVPGFTDQLLIDDRNDGGCKADKFERDARLLEQGLLEEPDNPRYMFYLGQTYADLANKLAEQEQGAATKMSSVAVSRTFDRQLPPRAVEFVRKAIEQYQRRVDIGGWEEEVYFSLYRIAMQHESLRDYSLAEQTYRRAIDFRPTRGEARCGLARLLRLRGRFDESLTVCEEVMSMPIPNDLLFVNRHCYRLYPTQDVAFIGFANLQNEHLYDKGFAACERLMTDRSLLGMLQQQCDSATFSKRVQEFNCILAMYCKPLIEQSQGDKDKEDDDDDEDDDEDENTGDGQTFVMEIPNSGDMFAEGDMANRMYPTNPSIMPHPTLEGKHLMNLRLVNYYIQRPLQYTFPHAEDGQRVLTKNALITIDMKQCELSEYSLFDETTHVPWSGVPNSICGLEDLRIFSFRGTTWATFTSCQAHPSRRPQICLGRLDENHLSVEFAVLLHGDFVQSDEKNWLPFVIHDAAGPGAERLCILYNTDPTTILDVDVETGRCAIVSKKPTQLHLQSLRGSCAPIRYRTNSSWLFMTHEVVYMGQDRVYLHRFVEMNDDFEIVRRSRPFTFFGRQVEFACGMSFSDNTTQTHLLITFGVWDRQAHLLQLPVHKVETMLRPLTDF